MKATFFAAAIAVALAGAADAKPGKGKAKDGPVRHETEQSRAPVGYGVGGCPPGLAKKNAACMPPGRYKKQFEVGQRVPQGFGGLLGYSGLPTDLRRHYGGELDPRSRYIYDQNYLYRVDPATMVVREVLRAVF